MEELLVLPINHLLILRGANQHLILLSSNIRTFTSKHLTQMVLLHLLLLEAHLQAINLSNNNNNNSSSTNTLVPHPNLKIRLLS